jgi:hypothetical protein
MRLSQDTKPREIGAFLAPQDASFNQHMGELTFYVVQFLGAGS